MDLSRRRSADRPRGASPLAHRDFRLLAVGLLIDSTGSWASSVVVAVLLYDRTGSLELLAALAAAKWVPGLLLAPVAGVLADRYDRRAIMTVSAIASGLVAVGLLAVVWTEGPPVLILAAQVLAAVVTSPYAPAAGALTPQVVDERSLPAANALIASLQNVVIVVGPAIGGLLVLLHQPAVGIAVNAASFFIAALVARALAVRSRGSARAGDRIVRQFAQGIRALRSTPTAALLLVFVALDCVLDGAYTVLYLPISEHLGAGTSGYGLLLAACAVGGIAGAFLAGRLSERRRLAPMIVGGLLAQSLPYVLTPLTSSVVVGALLQVVSGVGMVFVAVFALTAIQREVLGGSLSRVLGISETVTLLASVVGSFLSSALVSTLPYAAALVTLGGAIALLAVAGLPLLVRGDRRGVERAAVLADRVAVLRRIDLFARCAGPVLDRIAWSARPREVAAGTTLIGEGDAADALWVLASGTLGVTSSMAGALPEVSAPDVVGEIGVLRGIPRTATVTTLTGCTVWRIDADDYLTSVEPGRTPLSLLGSAAVRLRRTHPQLAENIDSE